MASQKLSRLCGADIGPLRRAKTGECGSQSGKDRDAGLTIPVFVPVLTRFRFTYYAMLFGNSQSSRVLCLDGRRIGKWLVLTSEHTLNKISWKKVTQAMEDRGSYPYGFTTTKKKYFDVARGKV